MTTRSFFFFNDTATTEIYTLSLHDALPIFTGLEGKYVKIEDTVRSFKEIVEGKYRSEEHTSELQSRLHLVCRLLLEKKKIHSQNQNTAYLPDYTTAARSSKPAVPAAPNPAS